jgi:hypothetical protein
MQGKDTRFTKENAREMQARAAVAHKENTAKRKAVAQVLSDMLSKPVSEGSKVRSWSGWWRVPSRTPETMWRFPT